MAVKLYTREFRQKMRGGDYELLHPHRSGDRVTIGRCRKGSGYIYISVGLREQLKLEERVYCYIHKKGSKLLLAFTEEAKFLGYRSIKNKGAVIGIPGTLLEGYLGKGEKQSIEAHVEDGNVFVDLEELRED